MVKVKKDDIKWKLVPEMASAWEHLNPVQYPGVDEATRALFLNAWHEHRGVYCYTLLTELPNALREAMNDQSPAIPREPQQPHARRCLLRAGSDHPAGK